MDKKLEKLPQAKGKRFETYLQAGSPDAKAYTGASQAAQFAQLNHLQANQVQQAPAESQAQDAANPLLTKHPRELTHIEKKMLKNEKLSAIWLQISKHALNQEYQTAYEMALTQTDDIYLLRLIMQTGPVLSRGLTDSTGKQVLQRLNRIVRGGIFYKLQVDWIDDSRKNGLFKSLPHQDQNEYLDTLYHMSDPRSQLVKPDLKERAGEVYGIVKNQAKNSYYIK